MDIKIKFDNSFSNLPNKFYSKVFPEKTKKPNLIILNKNLCKDLNLDYKSLASSEGINFLSGNSVLKNSNPLAMVYAGHQFGNWVPQLGDGRALLLGEVIAKNNTRYDIQLKGSGKTPYSRGGDGKAWVGPVIREYLVSEYMNKINIPTTRSLAAVTTGDKVFRETELPGAILCRVSKSHIRVGTLQYFHYNKDKESMQILINYLINRNYSYIKSDNLLDLFIEIMNKQSALISKWLSVGFIHGVMNTDNTSLASETIDYGPCAFLDNFENEKVFSSIDTFGRYSYGNQANIIVWNMACLASSFLFLIEKNKESNQKLFEKAIESMPDLNKKNWLGEFRKKLGLERKKNEDEKLIKEFLEILEQEKLDFTNSFNSLLDEIQNKGCIISQSDNFKNWKYNWIKRIQEGETKNNVFKLLKSNNPVFVMRNHLVQRTIDDLLLDKKDTLRKVLSAAEQPYNKLEEFKELYIKPTNGQLVHKTFCGT